MEIRQLKTFRTLARMGSFTYTAAALDYVQSTITAQIQSLEEELGVTLFDRLGKGVRLTDAGTRLLSYADQILQLADEARIHVTGTDIPTGTLRISAPETLCIYRLPQLLSEFHKLFPQVQVIFRPCRVADLRREVMDGNLDVAFVLEEVIQFGSLTTEVLRRESLSVIASPDHRLSQREIVYPGDLINEPILLTELGCNYRNLFENALIRAGVYPKSNLEFNSIEAIKQCVIAGMGISVLPTVAIQSAFAAGQLVCLPWFEPDFHVFSQMIWNKTRWQSPQLIAFVSLTRNMLCE